MISVVIPLYNKEKQIEKTLQSVLKQTFQNFEIVVVNDGSTDGSVAAAESVVDSRIRIIHQENAGVSVARNKGIKEALYDLVAFLDADDRWKPEYLQTQYELTQKYPECSVFACNYEFVHTDGSVHPSIIRKLPFEGQTGILPNYFEVASCSHPPICSISIMVRRSALLAIGGFPVGIKSGEDLLTWARLACSGKIAYSRAVLAEFHVEGYTASDTPKRYPDEDDGVGRALIDLLTDSHQPGACQYIALWYKMRASIYMRLGETGKCLTSCAHSLAYAPCNGKVYVMALLAMLPAALRNYLLRLI